MYPVDPSARYEKIPDHILISKTPMILVNYKGETRETSIEKLRNDHSKLLLTCSPGLFANDADRPKDWTAFGCSNQLTALNEIPNVHKDIMVIVINTHSMDYQQKILTNTNLSNLWMVSDASGMLQKEWNLPSFQVNDSRYAGRDFLHRWSVSIIEGSKAKYHPLSSAIGVDQAQQHALAILNTFNPPAQRSTATTPRPGKTAGTG
jgi:hypothetical protein